jgi:hypothetical protein
MTHYEVLGVAPDASVREVRRAYVRLAHTHHPDHAGGDSETMRALNDAWTTLRDPAQRDRYDRSLRPVMPAPEPRVRSDVEDLMADLADDTPLGGTVVLPGWYSLAPVAAFVVSLALFGAAMLFGSQPALALAMGLFVVSCVLFVVSPFVAMLASRRGR